jgi:predicted metal-dependent hydrolase
MVRDSFMGVSLMESKRKVQYEVIRKKGKRRLTIRITNDARVLVSAPTRYPLGELHTFVKEHQEWIELGLQRMRNLPAALPPHTYESGDRFLLQGAELVLQVQEHQKRSRAQAHLVGELLVVTAYHPTKASVQRAILNFYVMYGESLYTELVSHWVEVLRLSPKVQPSSITMVNYPTRMGCCTKDRRLRFALRSLMLPMGLVDYLALHEVAHLVHFNHGKEFKDLLAAYLPDWQARQKAMTQLRNRTARL